MSLCFLGAIQSGAKISADIQETLEGIDVLFVPIGGEGVLTAGDAYKLAVKLEPKIVIPMHFNLNGDKNSLKTFLKEAGEEVDSVEKFTFKKKDLEGKEVDVVVISES
jgi:L-ascorbate metabolism protein UlaG (beta-lactamase superfamily)